MDFATPFPSSIEAGKNAWPWVNTENQLPKMMPNGHPWPRISIVSPSFNQAVFVEETIQSVLKQGYPNLEYFVFDGYSTDGSPEIIKRYEALLTAWQSEPDNGQCHAINKGFARSTGEIMGWLNSDDVYYPGTLARVAQFLAGKKRTLLVGASITTETPYQLTGHIDKRQPSWDEVIYEARTFPQPSVFWTRDLWKLAGPLDEELYFAMDYDLWLRMQPHIAETIFVEEPFSFARSHPDQKGKTTTQLDRFLRQWVEVSLRAADLRGQTQLRWIIQLWLHRLGSVIRTRKVSLLKGSPFIWTATQLYLRGLRQKTT